MIINKKASKHYTHKNIKTWFGNYDTYHKPLSAE